MSALILFSGPMSSVELAPSSHERRAIILADSSQVESVASADEPRVAAEVCRDIKGLLGDLESARTSVKKPVLDLGRKIDSIAKDFSGQLDSEYSRVTRLMSVFQNAEIQRVEHENRRRADAIAELQAKEQAARGAQAAAEAKLNNPLAGPVELDRAVAAEAVVIQAAAAATTAIYAPLPEVLRATGMAVKRVPTVVVKDLVALLAHNPALVRMELNRSALNEILFEGSEFPGLEVTWSVAVSVRS